MQFVYPAMNSSERVLHIESTCTSTRVRYDLFTSGLFVLAIQVQPLHTSTIDDKDAVTSYSCCERYQYLWHQCNDHANCNVHEEEDLLSSLTSKTNLRTFFYIVQ